MASGKARSTKRGPSATASYSSATTIVIFVGLSVLGLWLLTSNSFAPSHSSTTKTPMHITSIGHTHRLNNLPQPHQNQNDPSSNPLENPSNDAKEDAAVVEPMTQTKIESDETQTDDNGEATLMDQVDTKESHKNEAAEEQEKQEMLETQTTEESSMTQKEHVEEQTQENPHSETDVEINDLETTQNHGKEEMTAEDGSLAQTSETTQNHGNEETPAEDGSLPQTSETTQNHGNEDTTAEEDGSLTQTSETTHNQTTDKDQQWRVDDHQIKEVDQQQKTDKHQLTEEDQQQRTDKHQITEEDQQQRIDEHQITEEDQQRRTDEHQITEEDQQRRIDEHQQQEDEQNQQREQEARSKDPNGATSHDQIQHDVAPINTHQDDSSSEETDEPNTHVVNQETKQDSLDEDTDKVTLSQKLNGATSNKNDEASSSNEDSTEIPKESTESTKSWSTQENQSQNQKERGKTGSHDIESGNHGYTWLLCNVTAGADYIPCLDNEKVIANIHNRMHHEHRERHCPEDPPTCLVPLPIGYKRRIDWPQSRDKIWYNNVPHTSLAEYKGHQNWVKVTGEFLTFPGGGTQFIHGALHYIDFIREAVPDIAWGKHTRVVLDVGCGVASFGGYLFERDVLTMSFAPKDEHEAQVQFALERGIPAISAVMGSHRLPFPSRVFDVVHCARCRVPWHADGGSLLLELNRVLRPGGYFVWSATPVYQKLEEDVQIWREMTRLTVSMCWELVTIKKDKINSIGVAIYQKPDSNDCYDRRKQNEPSICKTDDDPNAAWYIPLQSCMHQIPAQENERGSQWPEEWPERLQTPPYWLNKSQMGIYGKPAPDDFISDYEYWKKVVSTMYMNDMGINWSEVRNVMDLRAVYGGFAAALKDQNLWVMNVVNVDAPDTLPIIYERGLFGIYHDWCESFSTYPRTYDLLHADHLFSRLKTRCKLDVAMAEIDRILTPGGKLIMRDESSTVAEVEDFLKSLHWEVFLNHSKNQEGILSAQKSDWRPNSFADPS